MVSMMASKVRGSGPPTSYMRFSVPRQLQGQGKGPGHGAHRHRLELVLAVPDDGEKAQALDLPDKEIDGAVPGPVNYGRPEDGVGEPRGPDVLVSLEVGDMIRVGGGGPGPQGAHVQEAPDPRRTGRVHQVFGGLDVHPLEGHPPPRKFPDDAHQVNHRVAARHGRGDGAGGQAIPHEHLDPLPVPELPGGAPAHQGPDLVPPLQKLSHHLTADKAGGAGDQDSHRVDCH